MNLEERLKRWGINEQQFRDTVDAFPQMEACILMNISIGTLQSIMTALGLKSKYHKRGVHPTEGWEIWELFIIGFRAATICRLMGRSPGAVSYYVGVQGIKPLDQNGGSEMQVEHLKWPVPTTSVDRAYKGKGKYEDIKNLQPRTTEATARLAAARLVSRSRSDAYSGCGTAAAMCVSDERGTAGWVKSRKMT